MTCQHEWMERDYVEQFVGNIRKTEWHNGAQCIHCGHLRGGNRGLIRRRVENLDGPSGDVPEWLRLRLIDGEAVLRLPDSHRHYAEAERLGTAGVIDAEFRYNANKRDWVVSWISAPQAQPLTPLLLRLRTQVSEQVPGAAWIARATIRDLETAIAIMELPDWRHIRWPEKVWNSRIRSHSKAGNASLVARRLGLEVPERGTAIWLYGKGKIILSDGSQLTVNGEACLSDRQTGRLTALEGISRLGFMENPDAALAESERGSQLIVATWGALKPGHMPLLKVARKQGIPTWASFDMDPEGVRFARLARQAGIDEVQGFQAWPASLGLELEDEKILILKQELSIADHPFMDALVHIREHRKYWEQEATFHATVPTLPADSNG